MLPWTDGSVTAAAVGALQNMSREPASCQALLALPAAVEALAALLAADDVQVCLLMLLKSALRWPAAAQHLL